MTRLADPVDELSNHAVPGAVQSSVPEAAVRHRLHVVVEVYDVSQLLQQIRNVSSKPVVAPPGGRMRIRLVAVVVCVRHDVRLYLRTIHTHIAVFVPSAAIL